MDPFFTSFDVNLDGISTFCTTFLHVDTFFSFAVEFMWNFQNLRVFHLIDSDFSEFGPLMDAISTCKMLREIRLTDLSFGDKDLFSFGKKGL